MAPACSWSTQRHATCSPSINALEIHMSNGFVACPHSDTEQRRIRNRNTARKRVKPGHRVVNAHDNRATLTSRLPKKLRLCVHPSLCGRRTRLKQSRAFRQHVVSFARRLPQRRSAGYIPLVLHESEQAAHHTVGATAPPAPSLMPKRQERQSLLPSRSEDLQPSPLVLISAATGRRMTVDISRTARLPRNQLPKHEPIAWQL